MTPPLTRPIPWEVKAICLGMVALVLVAPHARSEGWLGWTAFLTIAVVCVGTWALLIRGMTINVIRWRRDRARPE